MDEYLKQYREMISLLGLTDHTIISYSTYIRAYLNYLSEILHKLPEDVSWAELRDFIRRLQKEKQLSDRTVNQFIFAKESQLGWEHRLSCHTFRHAFGTHLYENGTDLLTIKSLLGHKSLNSTTIYVHLASNGTGNTVSPFDLMGDGLHE